MISRRKFIQSTGISAASLPLISKSHPFFENTFSSQDDTLLRVAIMGLGSYANRVARAMEYCTRAKITGVVSGTPSKITDWQARYGIPDKNCYNYDSQYNNWKR